VIPHEFNEGLADPSWITWGIEKVAGLEIVLGNIRGAVCKVCDVSKDISEVLVEEKGGVVVSFIVMLFSLELESHLLYEATQGIDKPSAKAIEARKSASLYSGTKKRKGSRPPTIVFSSAEKGTWFTTFELVLSIIESIT